MSARPASYLSSLPDTALELWFVDLDAMAGALADAEVECPRLSAQEEQRAAGISDAQERQRWRTAHIALRVLLERWGGAVLRAQPFQTAIGGRPLLPAPAPHFSLSHSGPFALIALTRFAPLGVDLESVTPRKMAAARRSRIVSFAEAVAGGVDLGLANGDEAQVPLPASADGEDRAFIQAWCRVEAFAKADGRGLLAVLKEAGIMGPAGEAADLADLPGEVRATAPAATNGFGAGFDGLDGSHGAGRSLSSYRTWDIPLEATVAGYAAAVALARAARISPEALVPLVLEDVEAASTPLMRQADFVLSPPEDGG
ncbi:MAG: 4'-phosphopantetheinyl transferase superfamily protein [Hyphomicrobium sp.]